MHVYACIHYKLEAINCFLSSINYEHIFSTVYCLVFLLNICPHLCVCFDFVPQFLT